MASRRENANLKRPSSGRSAPPPEGEDEAATVARARKAFNEELQRRLADPRPGIDLARAIAEIRAEAEAEEKKAQGKGRK